MVVLKLIGTFLSFWNECHLMLNMKKLDLNCIRGNNNSRILSGSPRRTIIRALAVIGNN